MTVNIGDTGYGIIANKNNMTNSIGTLYLLEYYEIIS